MSKTETLGCGFCASTESGIQRWQFRIDSTGASSGLRPMTNKRVSDASSGLRPMANRRVSDASSDLRSMANQNGCGASSGLRPMANRAIDASSGLRPMAMKASGVQRAMAQMQLCKAQFPFCPHNKALGSWIYVKDGHLGCKACHLMGCASIWGSIRVKNCMMQKAMLQRHERCPMHSDAVARLTKCASVKHLSILSWPQAQMHSKQRGGQDAQAVHSQLLLKDVGTIPRKGK